MVIYKIIQVNVDSSVGSNPLALGMPVSIQPGGSTLIIRPFFIIK